ncbi:MULTISPECIES: cyclic peptide export ABC transporter [Pseudoalteromonas]|uniref:cyclic peptide export ABC transporter n=1 Tax=Pseudoalteromonas TaxID=53246 RepID=UPI00029A57E5|nr:MULTISPECIES: cyclic peptide export ABC transporter [Pseudoalteromonas]AUJ68493.1 ABC transporter ATP-binding protein YojI [Pseudoalteromonas sp. NC201]MBR8844094.1 cyclic peptide export ABC transporter [Pseudoalteromonas sp. JC3]MCF2829363.1 cyclic peptide export ABC transporter [Pseudoalteromonas sp. OF5H-5]MCF2831153.1 cyclic peptide export ABC transporter [Pseudoalteromonas sp. DL2-H6]MCF2926976.1 cyclic peptide export ABC transporter [Pseudoalteromonas sp. DL2-H1]
MRLLSELGKTAPNSVFISLLSGAIAGLIYASLVPVILIAIEEFSYVLDGTADFVEVLGVQIAHPNLALLFLGICAAIFILQSVSMIALQKSALMLASNIRKRLFEKILGAPIENLESVGTSKLLVVLSTDISRIMMGAQAVPGLLVSSVILLGVFLYIYFLSMGAFLFLLVCLVVSVITYQIPIIYSMRFFNKSRQETDELQKSFRSLLMGAKELKVNNVKRESFIKNELLKAENEMRETLTKTYNYTIFAENYGMLLTYLIIAVLVFSFVNYYSIGHGELLGIVMVLLYISGPIRWILQSIAPIYRANASYNKVDLILASLSKEVESELTPVSNWEKVTFDNTCFSYKKSNFEVGPISFSCRRGEITFIVGGNGSGKSTFCKVATLHYRATSGNIIFDDVKVDESNIDSYRQSISVIYSDYHLFEKLHGIDLENSDVIDEINYWLVKLNLDEKVFLEGDGFSTLELSDGQKRRLALIASIVEDKDFYLFDEWAADQDPQFREIFYKEILPILKSRNKLIIVITHDDRYYNLSDQLVHLDKGEVQLSASRLNYGEAKAEKSNFKNSENNKDNAYEV